MRPTAVLSVPDHTGEQFYRWFSRCWPTLYVGPTCWLPIYRHLDFNALCTCELRNSSLYEDVTYIQQLLIITQSLNLMYIKMILITRYDYILLSYCDRVGVTCMGACGIGRPSLWLARVSVIAIQACSDTLSFPQQFISWIRSLGPTQIIRSWID